MVETALPRGCGENWIDGSSLESATVREIALGRYHRIMDERRRDREGATGPERPNRREERTESGERGKEKSWRHSRHTARSLRSLWHGLGTVLLSLSFSLILCFLLSFSLLLARFLVVHFDPTLIPPVSSECA